MESECVLTAASAGCSTVCCWTANAVAVVVFHNNVEYMMVVLVTMCVLCLGYGTVRLSRVTN
jgi:hypothetical protein